MFKKLIKFAENRLNGEVSFARSERIQADKNVKETEKALNKATQLRDLYASDLSKFKDEYAQAERSVSIYTAELIKRKGILVDKDENLLRLEELETQIEHLKKLEGEPIG